MRRNIGQEMLVEVAAFRPGNGPKVPFRVMLTERLMDTNIFPSDLGALQDSRIRGPVLEDPSLDGVSQIDRQELDMRHPGRLVGLAARDVPSPWIVFLLE
jgi:hypothetical protein